MPIITLSSKINSKNLKKYSSSNQFPNKTSDYPKIKISPTNKTIMNNYSNKRL